MNKRKLKVQAEFCHIFESNQDTDVDNLNLLDVSEEDYQKMNVHQVETLLYSAKILTKVNKTKRKKLMENNKRICIVKDKNELDSGKGSG